MFCIPMCQQRIILYLYLPLLRFIIFIFFFLIYHLARKISLYLNVISRDWIFASIRGGDFLKKKFLSLNDLIVMSLKMVWIVIVYRSVFHYNIIMVAVWFNKIEWYFQKNNKPPVDSLKNTNLIIVLLIIILVHH